MALDLNAIKVAAEKMKQQAETKPESKKSGTKAQAKSTPNSEKPKTDTHKTKGGAKYVIPAGFKKAIENHLKGREDMKGRMSKKGKSIDGCCDYIFDVMRQRADKERNGHSAVGLYADSDEIFGLAVHYYDETEEALKEELKTK